MNALVRLIGPTFADAIVAEKPTEAIRVEVAAAQHAAYAAALMRAGVRVSALPPDPQLPDACFVEDQVVVIGPGRAVLTRVGHPDRRAEQPPIAAALADLGVECVPMQRGRLDGGDVLRIGDRWFVGRTARTDDEGIAELARLAPGEVVPVDPPRGVLHLKSACTGLGSVVIADPRLDPTPFVSRGLTVRFVPGEEAYGANLVDLGPRALVSDGFPGVAAIVTELGVEPIRVATTEFRKADGALTCLSILF